ncbi:MAG: roadblock/LC7 domain-containing protein [Candidatus Helarchaeota archaeon]
MENPLSEETKQTLTNLLQKLEARTELEACAVVSKEGMRIACAVGADLDADVYSAASAALVNLGETTLRQLRHGTLKEIIVRGDDGYTILTSAGPKHMIVGSCKNTSRMGYYLALLHRFSNKVAATLGFAVEAPAKAARPTPVTAPTGTTATSLLDSGGQKIPAQATPTPKPTHIQTPPLSQVQPEPVGSKITEVIETLSPAAEPEQIEIIEEPEPIEFPEGPTPVPISEPEPISIPEEPQIVPIQEPEPTASAQSEGIDKGTLFEALQALGVDKGQEAAPQQATDVDTQALMSALKPQPTQKAAPFVASGTPSSSSQKTTVVPFSGTVTPKAESDEDLFKISDKEAVLEALKVLGWEEPDDQK